MGKYTVSDIRFRRTAYVALQVTDLERSTAFLKDLVGLQEGGTAAGGEVFLRCSADHHNIVLRQGETPGIARLAFEMESQRALDAALEHLESIGISTIEVPEPQRSGLEQGPTFRFQEPTTRVVIELFSGMRPMPEPFTPTVAKIARLGHVVLCSTNRQATVDFFMKELNFRTSDQIGEAVTFMRCFPNPFHHTFAVAQAEKNGLHHVNFMVTDIDDVGAAMYRMQKAGVPVVFGPGRHSESSGSVFIYFLDPDGMTLEYSFGMEEFAEYNPRPAKSLPPTMGSFDNWGAAPPDPRFAKTGVVVDSQNAV
jgi:2,3-dihydroxy-p-cumate/2,3-dihydroxybenzoate 3,4-dioxygenase